MTLANVFKQLEKGLRIEQRVLKLLQKKGILKIPIEFKNLVISIIARSKERLKIKARIIFY